MKKIGNFKKSFVAMLLTLIMICGAVLPTLAYTAEGIADISEGREESAAGSAESSTPDWIDIKYTEDEIVITLSPEIDALLSINTADISSVIGKLVEAFETVIIDQIKDAWMGDNTVTPDGDSSSVAGITLDTVWEKALEGYVDSNYSEPELADRYIAFFGDIMNDDATVAGLVKHVCDLISLAVSAGVIAPEELPEANTELEEKLKNTLDSFIERYVRSIAEQAIEDYISDVLNGEEHGGSAIDDFAGEFISTHFSEVIKDYLEHKSAPDPEYQNNVVDKYIDAYIDSVIKKSVNSYISFMTDGIAPTLAEGFEKKAYEVMSGYVSDYIATLKNDYVEHKLGGEWTHGDKLLSIIDGFLDSFVSERVDSYIDYKSTVGTSLADADKYAAVYASIESLVFSECKDEISQATGETDEARLFEIYQDYRGSDFEDAISGKDLSYFKNTDNLGLERADYEAFKNSVTEKDVLTELSKPENRAVLDDYINGELARLEGEIASEFFSSYANSSDLELYVDDIISYVMTELDESDKDAVIDTVLGSGSLLGEALVALFGMGSGTGVGSAADKAVAELDHRIAYVCALLLYNGEVNYADTRTELMKKPPEITVKDLLTALETISVKADLNGDGEFVGGAVLQSGSVKSDALIAIFKDLPTLSDIAEMTPDKMKLCFEFFVESSFGDVSFDFVLRLDPDEKYSEIYSKINALAVILDNHIALSYSDGNLTAELIAPEIATAALRRVLNSTVIDDSLKEKIYSLALGDLSGAKKFFDELTFDEARLMLEAVDFEALIREVDSLADSNARLRDLLDRVKAKYDYTTITNDKILAKFDANEARFDRIKAVAARYVDGIYARIPADLKDKKISDLYLGQNNGYAEFRVDSGFSVNLILLSRKILEKCPEKYKGEAVYVLDLITQALGDSISGTLDLTVKVPGVAKVTYMLGKVEHRVGFLPTGVDPQKFAGITDYLGIPIDGWFNDAGEMVTVMPDEDIVLHAVLTQDVTAGISPDDREFIYDAQPHELVANVVYGPTWQNPETTVVTVEWYKGELATGALYHEGNTIKVTEIGEYVFSCRITVRNEFGEAVFLYDNSPEGLGAIYAKVKAPTVIADIDITDNAGVKYPAVDATYSDDKYYVLSTTLNERLAETTKVEWYYAENSSAPGTLVSTEATYIVRNVRESGEYYAVVYYTVGGVSDVVYTDRVTVKISPVTVYLSDIWNYSVFDSTNPYIIEYDGNEHTVVKDTILGKPVLDIFDTEYCTASAVGSYTASVTVKDPNYVIYGNQQSATLDWHIINEFTVLVLYNGVAVTNPSDITISGEYAYGSSHTVELVLGSALNPSVVWEKQNVAALEPIPELDGVYVRTFTNVESAVYKWTVSVTEQGLEREISGIVRVNITPKTLNVGNLSWSGDTEFTFNGEAHSAPTLSGTLAPDANLEIDYSVTLGGASAEEIKLPGDYTVTANLSLGTNPNYLLSSSAVTVAVKVNKAVFDASDVHWNYTEPFVYDGEEHSVVLVGFEDYPLIEARYSEESINAATEIGKYTAEFEKFVVVDGDEEYALEDCYTLESSSESTFPPSIEWEIVPVPVPVEKDEYIFDEDGIYVKVKDSEGHLLGYNMKVSLVSGYDIIPLVDGRKMKVAVAYDVIFENEEGVTPDYPEGAVFKVTFKVPEGIDLEKLEIVYIDPSVTEHVDVTSDISEDGTEVTFETSHFSIFAIATEHIEPETPPTPDDPVVPVPPTGSDDDSFDSKLLLLLLALLIIITLIILIAKRRKKGGYYARRAQVNDTAELYEDLKKVSWAKSPTVYVDGKAPDHIVISAPIKPMAPASSIATLNIMQISENHAEKTFRETRKPLPGSHISVVERFGDGESASLRKVNSAPRSMGAYSVTRINEEDLAAGKAAEKESSARIEVVQTEVKAEPITKEAKAAPALTVKEQLAYAPAVAKSVAAPEDISEKRADSVKERVAEVKESAPVQETEAPRDQAKEIDLPYLNTPEKEQETETVIKADDTPVEITAKDIPTVAPVADEPVLKADKAKQKANAAEKKAKSLKDDVVAEKKKAAFAAATVEAPSVEAAPIAEAPVVEATDEAAPIVEAPIEEATAKAAPIAEATVEEATAKAAPIAEATVEEVTAKVAPIVEAPVEKVVAKAAPIAEAPIEEVAAKAAPIVEAPIEEVVAEAAPIAEAPIEEIAAETAPIVEAPIEEVAAEAAPIVEAPIEEVAAKAAPIAEAPIEEIAAEAAPIVEAPVEEVAAKAAPIAEAPIEEIVAEAAPIAEASPIAETLAVGAIAAAMSAPETQDIPVVANAPEASPSPDGDIAKASPDVKRPSGVVKPVIEERKIIKASELDVPVTVFMAGEDVLGSDDDTEDAPEASLDGEAFDADTSSKDASEASIVAPIFDRTPEDDEVLTPEKVLPKGRIDLSSADKKPVPPDGTKFNLKSSRRYPKGRLSVEDMRKTVPHQILNP